MIKRKLIDKQAAVREFHKAAGAECPTSPRIPDHQTLFRRWDLIHEEFTEVIEAAQEGDIVKAAKEWADLQYVLEGGFLEFGLNMEEIFAAVHESNMTKFIGGVKFREDGKILKSENYKEPNLIPILREQGANV